MDYAKKKRNIRRHHIQTQENQRRNEALEKLKEEEEKLKNRGIEVENWLKDNPLN